MNLSFAGCGFLGIYHVGVAVCFKKYAPHLLLEKIGGASAGALSACCLLCDLPLGNMTSDFFRVVNEARRHSLGPFSPSFNIQTCLFEGLQKHLPDDAHKRVSGRLHISLTRVFDGKNVIISDFDSREELLQALLCACFIPGFSGIIPPKFRGVRYMDGAFSDNLPILDENTITVSPFCGESDICPRDQSSQLFHLNWANTSIEISRQNVNRFVRILFPPRPEFLSKFCQQGFDDALQFLHRNNLINCRRCVAVQSTFVVSETVTQPQDFDPECRECKAHRKDALSSNMPQTVLDVIQDYIEQANKGLANWIFKHRGIKLLSLPATVPMDFFLATISKISSLTPKLTRQMRNIIDELLQQLNSTIQIRVFNKFTLLEPPHFDTAGILHSKRLYGQRLSILVDECGSPSLEGDVDNYEHVLKVTTHNDALYAYYYTDDQTNRVKVTEIFDMTENDEIPTDMKVSIEDHTTPHQHIHNAEVAEWNGVEADFFIDEQTATASINNYNDDDDNNDNDNELIVDDKHFLPLNGTTTTSIMEIPTNDGATNLYTTYEIEEMGENDNDNNDVDNGSIKNNYAQLNKSNDHYINIEEDEEETDDDDHLDTDGVKTEADAAVFSDPEVDHDFYDEQKQQQQQLQQQLLKQQQQQQQLRYHLQHQQSEKNFSAKSSSCGHLIKQPSVTTIYPSATMTTIISTPNEIFCPITSTPTTSPPQQQQQPQTIGKNNNMRCYRIE